MMKFTDEQLTKLYERGLNDTQIARKLGVTPSAVSYRRRKLGLSARVWRPSPTRGKFCYMKDLCKRSQRLECKSLDFLECDLAEARKARLKNHLRFLARPVSLNQLADKWRLTLGLVVEVVRDLDFKEFKVEGNDIIIYPKRG